MMTLRAVLILSATLGLLTPALADEADLSDPIARSPELTLRDLVPAAVLERASNPFNLQVDVTSNAAEGPFEVTFDIALPEYPNATMNLLVSERESATGLMTEVLAMAEGGALPGGMAADMEALDGADCVGLVDQHMINCMIGTAGVQFTASDFLGGDSVDYDAVKALFATLPLENYRKLFGQ